MGTVSRRIMTAVGLAAVVAIAGCSDSGTLAVTIDGKQLQFSEIEARSSHLSGGSVEQAIYQSAITQTIFEAIVEEVVGAKAEEEFGIESTAEEVTARLDEFASRYTDVATFEAEMALQGYTPYGFRLALELEVVFDKLRIALAPRLPEVTPAEVEAFYAEHLTWFVQSACVDLIQVITEEEANAVKGRLDAGEDFEDLARELSIHTTSGEEGGSMGCGPLQYAEAFSDQVARVELGVISEPFEASATYNIIRVTERQMLLFDQVSEQIRGTINDEAMVVVLSDWILAQLSAAQIVVEPAYGTWDVGPPPQVVPPATAAAG